MILRGVSSGAQATVSSLQLVSDDFGDLLGSIFIQDPNQSPTPTVRIRSGNREFKFLHLVRATLLQLLARLQFLLPLVDILQLVRQGLFKQILELQLLKRLLSLICLRLTLAFLYRRHLHQRRHQPPPAPVPARRNTSRRVRRQIRRIRRRRA